MACYDSKNPNCGCYPLPLSKSARPLQVHREQMRALPTPERKATLY